MTRPRRIPNYTGATGAALDPAAGLALDADRHGWMVKHDGLFCTLTTGPDGRIDSATSQAGAPIADAADLLGIHAAPPFSTLVGEFSGHTTAGRDETAARGYAVVHLFDCTRLAGVPLIRAPYQERHGALYRAQSWVESEGLARRREWTTDRQGDAHATRGAEPGTCYRPARRGDTGLDAGGRFPPGVPARTMPRAGRYVKAIPMDLRRLPVTPIIRGATAARELWDRVELENLEGLVAVDLRAPVGRPGAKRKIKLTDHLDGIVVASDSSCSRVAVHLDGSRPRDLVFVVPGAAVPGSWVSVSHNGWYASGLPRFPRLVRHRPDKMPVPDRGRLIEWAA